ncbi:MAG: hypothetical protein EXR79_01175 [Myxococcales bacterium]|nr:hypothetical protein [Myxococcales bacterium]
MKYEFKMHGVSVRSTGAGQVALSLDAGGVVLDTHDFVALSRMLQAVALVQSSAAPDGARQPGQPAQQDGAGPAAAVVISVPARSPGRPATDATGGTPVTAAQATGPAAAVRGPGRPRTSVAGSSAPAKAPAPAKAAAQPDHTSTAPTGPGPGRPRRAVLGHGLAMPGDASAKVRRKPGPKPRVRDASAPLPAAPGRLRQATLGVVATGAPPPREGPARGRRRVVAPGEDTAARRGGPRFIDLVDGWMKLNPGAKTREEIVRAAIDNGWTEVAKAKHLVDTTIPRFREIFLKNTDGSYVRRAEKELRLPAVPGKVNRRRGGVETRVAGTTTEAQ